MEEQESRRGRSLDALKVAAVAGFVEDMRETQELCLGILNTCRDRVPMPLLRITQGMPSSLLRMLCPGMSEAEGDPLSRVLAHRRVLSVEWTFPNFRSESQYGSSLEGEARQQKEEDWGAVAAADIDTVAWPEGTQEITLYCFNRPIQGVVWPASLERLVFVGEPLNMCTIRRR